MDSLEHREAIYLHHMPLERVRADPFPTLLPYILLFYYYYGGGSGNDGLIYTLLGLKL